jgi:hypothetical protein
VYEILKPQRSRRQPDFFSLEIAISAPADIIPSISYIFKPGHFK